MDDIEELRRKNREKMRKWRAENPEKAKANKRVHYVKHADAIRAKKRAYRAANPEKYRQTDRERYAANPGKHAAYVREWRRRNPDKVRESTRRNIAKHPEKRRQLKRNWSAANPEKVRAINRRKYVKNPIHSLWLAAKSRAQRNGIHFTIAEHDIRVPPDMVCPVFGMPMEMSADKQSDNSLSLDRIDPRTGYVLGNVRVISWLANNLKGKATLEQLIALGEDAKRILADQASSS
jgi:hypothetical protein